MGRLAALAVLLAGMGLGACTVRDLPDGRPSANSVYEDLREAGLPVIDGRPEKEEFSRLVDENRCEESRSFVRSDADQGWGLICVGLDRPAFKRLSEGFETTPALLGALYADAHDGDVVVFGFGWPDDASRTVHDALGDEAGTYLGPSR